MADDDCDFGDFADQLLVGWFSHEKPATPSTKKRQLSATDLLVREPLRRQYGPNLPPPAKEKPPPRVVVPAVVTQRITNSLPTTCPNNLVKMFDDCPSFGPRIGITRVRRLNRAMKYQTVDQSIVLAVLADENIFNHIYT